MVKQERYVPSWWWWRQSGERLKIGLDLRRLMAGNSQREPARVQRGLARCLFSVEAGDGIVDAMKHSGMDLPVEAWCLLQAGERTGRLGESICDVGELLKRSARIKKEIIGQAWYPGFVVLVGSMVMAIMLLWVVPQMSEISSSMGGGGKVPWITQNIGKLYGSIFAGAAALLLVASITWNLLRKTAARSLKWARLHEDLCCSIPLYSRLRRLAREARILRQVGTLLRGGITFPDALKMAADNSPDAYEAYQLIEFRKRQLMGISFEQGLNHFPLIERGNHALLVTGQETGRLDDISLSIAGDVELELSLLLKQLLKLIEPVTIITLAGLVAGLILAFMLPTVSMLEQLA